MMARRRNLRARKNRGEERGGGARYGGKEAPGENSKEVGH